MIRRLLHIDWRTWFAFGFAVFMMFAVIDRERVLSANERLAEVAEQTKTDSDRERAEFRQDQRRLQDRINELVEQNAQLVRLFEEAGIEVPSSLIARGTTTRITTGDNDDDDDGGDTIIVRPDGRDPTTSPRPTTPPPSDDPPDVDLPDVPLPDAAGGATDTAKDIIGGVSGLDVD